MKWTKISAIIGTVLLVTALTLKLTGYETEAKVSEPNKSLEHFDWEAAEEWIRSERNKTEPNEPEATSSWCYITDLNEPKKVSLDFIPTWPDYIELEKDLVLRFDFPEPNNLLMKLIHEPTAYKIFSKGTKIYFKENE